MPHPSKGIPCGIQITAAMPLDAYTTATALQILRDEDALHKRGWHGQAYRLLHALLLHTGAQQPEGRGTVDTVAESFDGGIRDLLVAMSASEQRQVAEVGSEWLNAPVSEAGACFAILRSHVATHLADREHGYRVIVADQARAFAREIVGGEAHLDLWKDEAERVIAALYAYATKGNPSHDRMDVADVTGRMLQSATIDTWSRLSKSCCPFISAVATDLMSDGDAMREAIEAVAGHYLAQYQLRLAASAAPTTH